VQQFRTRNHPVKSQRTRSISEKRRKIDRDPKPPAHNGLVVGSSSSLTEMSPLGPKLVLTEQTEKAKRKRRGLASITQWPLIIPI
jgi:hypothetical protein